MRTELEGEGLMESLKDLKQKIQVLETERSRLASEIENLRRIGESRAFALEKDVSMMRDEVKYLRDFLGSPEDAPVARVPVKGPEPVAATVVAAVAPVAQAAVVEQSNSVAAESEPVSDVSVVEEPVQVFSSEDAASEYEPLLKTLSEDERKVVDVLLAHDGKYAQKNIRTDAKLSWLQTNRIISRLAERGIIILDKNGPLGNIVLAEPPKK
jgi:hypothetical protein